MTTFTDAAASPPIAPFRVHYVDSPRDFSSVPLKDETSRPVVAALVVAAVVAAAIGAIFAALMLSLWASQHLARGGRGCPTLRASPTPGAERAAVVRLARTESPVRPRAGRRSPRRRAALLTISAVFAWTDAPSVSSAIRARSHGVSAGPPIPAASASRDRLLDGVAGDARRRAPRRRAPARTRASRCRAPDRRGSRTIAPPRRRPSARAGDADPGRARVEPGHLVLADRHDRHAAGLEVLERGRHVEDRLRPGAHDRDRRAGQLVEVGRDVERRRPGVAERAAMDAADAAGREDPDPGCVRRDHRRGDGRRRPAAAASAAARFGRAALRTDPGRRRRERLEVVIAQPDEQPALVDARPSPATAPRSRTAASDARATSRFCGYGSPWLISVDSRATTGRPTRARRRPRGAMARRSADTCVRAYRRREGDGTDRACRPWRRSLPGAMAPPRARPSPGD